MCRTPGAGPTSYGPEVEQRSGVLSEDTPASTTRAVEKNLPCNAKVWSYVCSTLRYGHMFDEEFAENSRTHEQKNGGIGRGRPRPELPTRRTRPYRRAHAGGRDSRTQPDEAHQRPSLLPACAHTSKAGGEDRCHADHLLSSLCCTLDRRQRRCAGTAALMQPLVRPSLKTPDARVAAHVQPGWFLHARLFTGDDVPENCQRRRDAPPARLLVRSSGTHPLITLAWRIG